MANGNNQRLKAFVRFDGTGRVVAGSLILRKKAPKVGNWHEITAYECCNYTPALRFSSDIAPGGEQGCFGLRTADDGGPDVNGVIDWGDGTIENIVISVDTYMNFTHNYLEGSYTATVTFDTPERIITLSINCKD